MKKILVAYFTLFALAAPAFAADMPTKSMPMKAAPYYDPWTGFYAGASVGARWSDSKWLTVTGTGGGPVPPVGPNNPASLSDSTFRVGGYAGYNWKVAPAWLVGLEADIAWGRNNSSVSPFPGTPGGPFGGGPTNSDTVKLGWDGSVRGRLGYLVDPMWLVYATGGVAWQKIETTSSCGTGGGFCGGGVTVSGTSSDVKVGWTVGGGVETALWSHWLARVEYRYSDFGTVSNDLPPAAFAGLHSDIKVRTNTAIVGLAYKF